MYFAIDPACPSVSAEIFEALCALRAHSTTPLELFALIDAAFDEALLANRRWIRQPKFSLYEHTALHGLTAAGPHLVPAPIEPDDQPSWLRDIFAACAGRPMLSILASALPAPALRMHLRPYLVARTPDGMEWPVRWGDSRVLPALLEALEAPQREHLLSPLQHWWSVSRSGTLTSWRGGASPSPTPAAFDRLPVNDAVFSHLVDLAEADAVIADIHDTQPDLLRRHGGAASHARVARHLGLANQHGITAAGARQHFSVLALCLDEDFATHPAMRAALERTRAGADYRTEIAALPARFWQDAAPK
ncbi:hypothetical protein AZOA_25460 [Azoarcus sp. Aa7]|nr:hypothetical protein [Azoarcus sp. Aa7]